MTEFHFRPEHIAFLLSDAYERIRGAIADMREKYADPLTLQTELRARFPGLAADLLAAASVQAELQRRHAARLRLPEGALLTPVAAQQASSRDAARFHASLFAGLRRVADLCSGIGSDAAALLEGTGTAVCVERDALVALLLRRNLDLAAAAGSGNAAPGGRDVVLRGEALVLRGDAERCLRALRPGAVDGMFADPDRRAGGRRTADPEQASPPFSFFESLPPQLALAVKLSPGARLRGGAADRWRRVFLAAGGECTEQLALRGIDAPPLSVVDAGSGERWIPPAGVTSGDAVEPSGGAAPFEGSTAGAVLLEPHAAIVAAGAADAYFASLGARAVQAGVAYGFARALPAPSRWHRGFAVIDVLPFQRRRLQEAIDRLDFSPDTEIKKRGFPLLPEELRRGLRFRGATAGVLVATRSGGRHVVYLCRRAD